MPSNNQRYTRWRNDEPIEEEPGDTSRLDESMDIHEYDEDAMQEGRRVLAMNQNSTLNPSLSKFASYRLIGLLILTTTLCFAIGLIIGYSAARGKTVPSVPLPTSSPECPTFPAARKPFVTTTLPPKTTPSSIEGGYEIEDIAKLSSHFIDNLSKDLIDRYFLLLHAIKVDPYSLLMSTFQSLNYVVDKQSFSVKTSVPDFSNPSKIEIIYQDNSTEIITPKPVNSLAKGSFINFGPAGTASGYLIYANLGTEDDFKKIEKYKINSKEAIILIRQSNIIHPSAQVLLAQMKGASGVILFPHPFDLKDAYKLLKVKPDGNGFVNQNLRPRPGDPSTPFYASQDLIYRLPEQNYTNIPKIPVLAVTSNTGLKLLNILDGPSIPLEWNLDSKMYRMGGSFKNASYVRMTSTNRYHTQDEKMIMAYRPAKDHSKVVHIGCHYEFKEGTKELTSSGIGLVAMLALADAIELTVNTTERLVVFTVFQSKRGDYSVSKEFTDLNSWWIQNTGLAYIDINSILKGSGYLEANVSPMLRETVKDSLKRVPWPSNEELNVMNGLINNLPTYHPNAKIHEKGFQQAFKFSTPFECDEAFDYHNTLGIPTVQLSAIHSNYKYKLLDSKLNSIDNYRKLNDQNFKWTNMVLSSLGIIILSLSSTELPPLRFEAVGWDFSNAWKNFLHLEKNNLQKADSSFNLNGLIEEITDSMEAFVLHCEAHDNWYKKGKDRDDKQVINERRDYINLETRLLKARSFGQKFFFPRFFHTHHSYLSADQNYGSLITFGPSSENPCKGEYFPGLRRALKSAVSGQSSWNEVKEHMSLILSVIIDFKSDV